MYDALRDLVEVLFREAIDHCALDALNPILFNRRPSTFTQCVRLLKFLPRLRETLQPTDDSTGGGYPPDAVRSGSSVVAATYGPP
jgi:hypothetical protein